MKFYILSLACLLLLLLPTHAHASYWIKCEVVAKVIGAEGDIYKIKVLSGEVLDGHANKGSECLAEDVTYDIEIQGADIEEGGKVDLLYDHYNAMGPEGLVEGTTWTLSP